MTTTEISHIIQSGKLSGYHISGGFILVQWKTDELKDGEYWLFKFLSANDKLISVKRTTPSWIFKKWQAKRYAYRINDLIHSLVILEA